MALNPGCTNCVPKKPAEAVDCSFEPTVTGGGSLTERIRAKVEAAIANNPPNGGTTDNNRNISEVCINRIASANRGNPHGFNYHGGLCGINCNQLVGQNISITWKWTIKVNIKVVANGSATISCSCLDCECSGCGDCSGPGGTSIKRDEKDFTINASQTQSFNVEANAVPGLINLPPGNGGRNPGGRDGGRNPGGGRGGRGGRGNVRPNMLGGFGMLARPGRPGGPGNGRPGGPGNGRPGNGRPGNGGPGNGGGGPRRPGNGVVEQACFFRKQGGTPDPVLNIPDFDFTDMGEVAAVEAFNKAVANKGDCAGPDNCSAYISAGSATGAITVTITATPT
jgi:hypothetical protein